MTFVLLSVVTNAMLVTSKKSSVTELTWGKKMISDCAPYYYRLIPIYG